MPVPVPGTGPYYRLPVSLAIPVTGTGNTVQVTVAGIETGVKSGVSALQKTCFKHLDILALLSPVPKFRSPPPESTRHHLGNGTGH
jgi:hypothetical protein